MANAVSAGADFVANESLRDLGAKPIAQAEATSSEKRYYAQLRKKHDSASLNDKIFSLQNRYSFASQVVANTPASPSVASAQAARYVASFANPSLALQNLKAIGRRIASLFVPTAMADVPYRNPFGLRLASEGCDDKDKSLQCVYGFTQEELDSPLGSEVTKKLDKEIACSLIANIEPGDDEKPEECIQAENESNGDTVSDGGVDLSGAGAGAEIVGNAYSESTKVACAKGTKDLGIYDSYVRGVVVKARLCSLTNLIYSRGDADKIGNTYVANAEGFAIVNSRVSGAWAALARAAKEDGINLRASSSFRTYAQQVAICNESPSCRAGDSTGVAQPGYSSHQAAVAIDFDNMGGFTPKSGATCANRMTYDSPEYRWMKNNASKFGFRQYAAESWHFDALTIANRCE